MLKNLKRKRDISFKANIQNFDFNVFRMFVLKINKNCKENGRLLKLNNVRLSGALRGKFNNFPIKMNLKNNFLLHKTSYY